MSTHTEVKEPGSESMALLADQPSSTDPASVSPSLVEVDFGGQKVQVPKGGYYDRYRMNPNLEEVARDPAVGNLDFFREIPKEKVPSRVGPTWAPNFYYRMSNVQLLFLAPIARLREKLPKPLEPLHPLPGYGLVALTFFSYPVCDNDPYDEVSIAIITRRPGARGSQILELLKSIRNRSFYAHVLALPVTTEIARVRGVYGYQLPKWLAHIDIKIGTSVEATITATDGTPDLALTVPFPALRNVPSQSEQGTNYSVYLIDGQWHQVAVRSNPLSVAQRLFPRDAKLSRNGGPLSQLLEQLGVSTILRLDVVKEAQMVLHMPAPLKTFG